MRGYKEEGNDELKRRQLMMLVKDRIQASNKVAIVRQRATRFYNKIVQPYALALTIRC